MSGDPVATASGSDLVGFADFLSKAIPDLGQRNLASGTVTPPGKYPVPGNLVIMSGPYIHQLMPLEVKPEQATASDVDLLHAVARGDEAALARLYDQYRVILFGLLVRILGSREEAEDVLQDVFIQVWRRARDFDEQRGKPFTWLVTLARSRAIDRLRQLGARQRLAGAAANDETDQVSDALSDAIQSGQREIVQRALAELPEEQKQALVLAYYDGLTQSEIASKLGAPLGTVKTRMRSGMAKLRGLLSTQLENFGYTGKA